MQKNIEIHGHVPDENGGLYIAWDLDGTPMDDLELQPSEIMELMLQADMIEDYHNHGMVAVRQEGRKSWLDYMDFFKTQLFESADQFCIDLLTAKYPAHVK